jgi:hypothetical protein
MRTRKTKKLVPAAAGKPHGHDITLPGPEVTRLSAGQTGVAYTETAILASNAASARGIGTFAMQSSINGRIP